MRLTNILHLFPHFWEGVPFLWPFQDPDSTLISLVLPFRKGNFNSQPNTLNICSWLVTRHGCVGPKHTYLARIPPRESSEMRLAL